MRMKKTTLWHGTSTGEQGRTLRAIFNDGLLSAMADTQRSHQRAGIHFSAERDYAAIYAQGEPGDKGGDPLLVKVRTAIDARQWDLDHEAVECSLRLLSQFKTHIAKMPPHLLDMPQSGETVTGIKTTRAYLVLSGHRSRETFAGNPGAFEYKIPWADSDRLYSAMPAHMYYKRLQAMHDYLRVSLKEKYTVRLQTVLDDVTKSRVPIKYIGETGLIAEKFYTQPLGLGYDYIAFWRELGVPMPEGAKPGAKPQKKLTP